MQLAGKVALITGAGGGGSGRAIVRRMAADGATVVVCDSNEAGGRATVRLIESAGGRAATIVADVGVEADVQRLFDFAEQTFGGVDVLVNNASASYPAQGQLTGWFPAIQVDLLGTMYCTLRAVEAMRRRGGGAIVNISSTSAIGHGVKHSNSPAYDVAKIGVLRLATALGPLAASHGVRVNCLVPDWVASPEVQGYVDSLTPQERREQGVPERLISLEEIADAVVELATDERLAGRVMVWWCGQPRRFSARGRSRPRRLGVRASPPSRGPRLDPRQVFPGAGVDLHDFALRQVFGHLHHQARFELGWLGPAGGRVAAHARIALDDFQLDDDRQLQADALVVVDQRLHAFEIVGEKAAPRFRFPPAAGRTGCSPADRESACARRRHT